MKNDSLLLIMSFLLLTVAGKAQEIQFNYRSVVENMEYVPEAKGYELAKAKMLGSSILIREENQSITVIRNPGKPDSIKSIYYYDEKRLVGSNGYFFKGYNSNDKKYFKMNVSEASANIGENCGPEEHCEYLTIYVK